MSAKLSDKELISLFVKHLAQNGRAEITVTAWPDETNRQLPDIDAVAGDYAIEHSSFDTIPNQRRDSAWFEQVVRSLQDEFRFNLPYRLILTFPYAAIQRGQNWSGITTALRVWLLNDSPLSEMNSYYVKDVPGIPFTFHVNKRICNHKRFNRLLFGRFVPNDSTFLHRLREQLDRKINKLSPYKNKGKTTILLVESEDMAFMDDGIMWDGLRGAYPDGMPQGLDEIWFADTSIPEEILFDDLTQSVAMGK